MRGPVTMGRRKLQPPPPTLSLPTLHKTTVITGFVCVSTFIVILAEIQLFTGYAWSQTQYIMMSLEILLLFEDKGCFSIVDRAAVKHVLCNYYG